MLELGTSHNRWLVERQFIRMAGADCDPQLAARIKMEIVAENLSFVRQIRHLERSIGTSADQLHALLQELVPEE